MLASMNGRASGTIDRRSAVGFLLVLPLGMRRAIADPRWKASPVARFPFHLLANAIYFRAKLNGNGPYLFSLDTGRRTPSSHRSSLASWAWRRERSSIRQARGPTPTRPRKSKCSTLSCQAASEGLRTKAPPSRSQGFGRSSPSAFTESSDMTYFSRSSWRSTTKDGRSASSIRRT